MCNRYRMSERDREIAEAFGVVVPPDDVEAIRARTAPFMAAGVEVLAGGARHAEAGDMDAAATPAKPFP